MPNAALASLRERTVLLVGLATVIVASYIYLNRHPFLPPRLLTMTRIDSALPFWVWSVWPYTFLTLSNGILPFLIRRRDNLHRMAVAMAVAMAMHVMIWTLWPTTYARPVAPDGDNLSEQLYLLLISVDTPGNCFPSAHITAPALQLYFVGRERPRLRRWLWTIFIVFAPSILTTKQHYLWDMMGAVITVLIATRASQWWFERRGKVARSTPKPGVTHGRARGEISS